MNRYLFKELTDPRLRTALRHEYYAQVAPGIVMCIIGYVIMAVMLWYEIKQEYILWVGGALAVMTVFVLGHLILSRLQKIPVVWQYTGFYVNTALVGFGFGIFQAYHLDQVSRDMTVVLVLFIAGLVLLGMKAFVHSPAVFWVLVAGSVGPELVYFYSNGSDFYNLTIALLTTVFAGLNIYLNWEDFKGRIKYYILNFNLNDAKDEIEQAKMQQDGDYYLISLLVDPLVKEAKELGSVTVKSVLKQKKEFQFRGHEREIGGDINIVDDIVLNGKPYIALTNADAMGKSIQGAGGALVFGTIFNAILNRTRTRETEQAVEPKDWLLNTYRELEDIFASFDGRMSISFIAALVDEEGRVYFLNIEHPFIVLYRGGKARFLEKKIHAYRVGYGQTHQHVDVRMMQLKPGDLLLLGSDGRDDVEYNGTGKVNSDHTKILDLTIEAGGDVQKLYENLSKLGRFTDDCSLLSIAYTGSNLD